MERKYKQAPNPFVQRARDWRQFSMLPPVARVPDNRCWPFNIRGFAAGFVAGFAIVAFAGPAELPRSHSGAPGVVLRLAEAYLASLPEQQKEGHQSELRDMFVRSFFWGFTRPDGKLTSGDPVNFAGDAAGRQYRLSNPDKLAEVMQGFGYVATNAQGTWSRGFELSRFRTEGDSGRGWWLMPLPEPSTARVVASEIPPSGGPVRIAGFLSPKGQYGHLGMCDHQFFATSISLVKIGQDGAASRGQPPGSETNRTPGAVGPGR